MREVNHDTTGDSETESSCLNGAPKAASWPSLRHHVITTQKQHPRSINYITG